MARGVDQGHTVVGNAGEVEVFRRRYQRLFEGKVERAAAAQVEIEAVETGGDDEIERFVEAFQDFRSPPCGWQGAGHFRREDRAGVELKDAMAARLHETDMGIAALVVAGMEGRAPPPHAPGRNRRRDRRRHARVTERLLDQPSLPGPIGGLGQCLHRAAAALREMRAGRRDAIGGGRQHFDEFSTLAIHLGADSFARQGVGDEDQAMRPAAHAFAARAEPFDVEQGVELDHAALPAEIRGCRRRLRWARESRRQRASQEIDQRRNFFAGGLLGGLIADKTLFDQFRPDFELRLDQENGLGLRRGKRQNLWQDFFQRNEAHVADDHLWRGGKVLGR